MNKPSTMKHLVIFKDLHNQMIVQMPIEAVSLLWIVTNFSAILRQLFIQYPPLAGMFERGEICGVEVQLL